MFCFLSQCYKHCSRNEKTRNIGFNTNANTQEPYKKYRSKMKYQNYVTKGSSQNITDTLVVTHFPLITQFFSTQNCVTKEVSTVYHLLSYIYFIYFYSFINCQFKSFWSHLKVIKGLIDKLTLRRITSDPAVSSPI